MSWTNASGFLPLPFSSRRSCCDLPWLSRTPPLLHVFFPLHPILFRNLLMWPWHYPSNLFTSSASTVFHLTNKTKKRWPINCSLTNFLISPTTATTWLALQSFQEMPASILTVWWAQHSQDDWHPGRPWFSQSVVQPTEVTSLTGSCTDLMWTMSFSRHPLPRPWRPTTTAWPVT